MPNTAAMPDDEPAPEKKVVPFKDRLPNHPSLPSEEEVKGKLLARSKPATDDQIETALWVLTTASDLGLTTYGAISRWLKIHDSLVSKYLRGVYEADLGELTTRINQFRDDWERQQKIGEMPFVSQLGVVQKIAEFCDLVRYTRQIGPIWGESQTGKSWALDHIAADPSKDTILVRLPASGTQLDSINALADACGVPTRKDDSEKRERILRRITSKTLLIIDEWHQAFIGRKLKMGLIERIREIHDLKKCGIVPVGTPIYMDMMERKELQPFLSQMRRRGVLRLSIPTAPFKGDLDLIFTAYGLPSPKREVRAIVEKITTANGIGELTKYFQVARCLAVNRKEPLNWSHFETTHATLIQGGRA